MANDNLSHECSLTPTGKKFRNTDSAKIVLDFSSLDSTASPTAHQLTEMSSPRTSGAPETDEDEDFDLGRSVTQQAASAKYATFILTVPLN